MANHRINMLSNIEPEFPRHASEYSGISDNQSKELDASTIEEAIQNERERSTEHSFIKRLFLKAAKKLTPKYTESQVVLSKKI